MLSDGYDLFVVSADGLTEENVGHFDDVNDVVQCVFENAEEWKRDGLSPRAVAL